MEETVLKSQIEALSQKIEKQLNLYNILKMQHTSKKYEEVATNKFKPAFKEETLLK
mgnify:CR=1 FL=1|jgi:hypothetical protein